MNNIFKKAIAAACLLSAATFHNAQAKEMIILLDASLSNPMLSDKAFNRRAGDYVIEQIKGLKRGDDITLQSFGSLQEADNFYQRRAKLTRHNHKKVARQLLKYIRALPQEFEPQGSTNLIAWFNRNPQRCEDVHKIIVLTDAIEASEWADSNKLLSGEADLPKPSEFVNIKGCHITFFGIGAGRLDKETMNLRRAWAQYFNRANAKFEALTL